MITLLLFAPRIHIVVVLRAHPVRGKSHIERNANGEFATVVTVTGGWLRIISDIPNFPKTSNPQK